MTPARDRSDVDAVRAALADPRDVARRLGLERPRDGGGRWRCPAHGGVALSLTRGPDGTLRVRCFGCELSGDVFSLVASVRGWTLPRDFRDVMREAADLAAIALPDLSPEPPAPPTIGDELFTAIAARLLGLAPLRRVRDACEYLAGRGVAEEAARDGWGALPRGGAQDAIVRRLVGEFGVEAMLGSGLVREGDRGLRFASPGARVLIPWRGDDGRVLSLQRRRLDAQEPRYIATTGRPLREPYGLERLRTLPAAAPIAFVEGAIDVLALRALCRRRRFTIGVLAIPGVETWRARWAEIGRGRRTFVAIDNEPRFEGPQPQGKRWTWQAVEGKAEEMARDLEAAGARPKRWRPRAKDWAEQLGETLAG